jgi:hypothetical protein
VNDDGYELGGIDEDNSWEMEEMTDGCWADTEAGNDETTDEDLEEFNEAWDENSFEGVEELGWSNQDTEYWYHGPLVLTNEDTGEEFTADSEELIESESLVDNTLSTEKTTVSTGGVPEWPFPTVEKP